jgi:hypothetical protein
LAVDGNGHVYVTGYSAYWTGSYYLYDYATVAYSSAGGQLWWNSYNGPGNANDQASAVAVDASGNVLVTGSSYGTNGNYDYYTAKYAAADGAMLWEKRYNGPANSSDSAQEVAVDASVNVLVTGYSNGTNGYPDYYTAKYVGSDRVIYVPPTNFSGTDTFTYVVQDSSGLMSTGTVSVTIQGPPQIAQPPQSIVVAAGSNCSFSVSCTGVEPFAYQWRKGGVPLSDGGYWIGSASNLLACALAITTDSGSFDVVITNAYGSVTSSVATLTVDCPAITVSGTVPATISLGQSYGGSFPVLEGGSYTFAVSGALPSGLALGTSSGNTVPVTGTPDTLGTYVFTITATDSNLCSGSQTCTQAVVCPVFSFSPATLPAAFTGVAYNQPLSASYSGQGGGDVILYGLASGSLPAGMSLATNGIISGVATVPGSFGFTVTATNQYGCTGNRAYTLNVYVPPGVNPPAAASVVFGTAGFTLTMSATGSEPLYYQWRFNGVDIAGANSATLSIALGTLTNAGNYDVVISNPYGSVTSSVVAASFYGELKFYAGTTLAGGVGSSYRVDYADVIGGVTNAWQVLTNLTLPHSPYLVVDPGSPGRNQRFYRAVPVP